MWEGSAAKIHVVCLFLGQFAHLCHSTACGYCRWFSWWPFSSCHNSEPLYFLTPFFVLFVLLSYSMFSLYLELMNQWGVTSAGHCHAWWRWGLVLCEPQSQGHDCTHSCCVHVGFAGTDLIVTFKLLLGSLLCNLIDMCLERLRSPQIPIL